MLKYRLRHSSRAVSEDNPPTNPSQSARSQSRFGCSEVVQQLGSRWYWWLAQVCSTCGDNTVLSCEYLRADVLLRNPDGRDPNGRGCPSAVVAVRNAQDAFPIRFDGQLEGKTRKFQTFRGVRPILSVYGTHRIGFAHSRNVIQSFDRSQN